MYKIITFVISISEMYFKLNGMNLELSQPIFPFLVHKMGSTHEHPN